LFDTIAVVGATGAVGQIICQLLEERDFPARRVRMLASVRSLGQRIIFRGEPIAVEPLSAEGWHDCDLCIASTPDDVAREFIPHAVRGGALVIDESGAWRMDPTVPLVVPEVNPGEIAHHQGIISSPNCSTTQLVVAMKPLYDAVGIERVVVSTYQAASGAGVVGQRDLMAGTRAQIDGGRHDYEAFPHPIAMNLIPQIGSARTGGYTSEEMKMVLETRKIFADDNLRICPTCVRVPVSNCHSESILVETRTKITAAEATALFQAADGITVVDDLAEGMYPMPIACSGRDEVFVGRIREDLSSERGITFWCVSDNLRKGAATNAVQIAELLAARQGAVRS
jgi:aspartate-semialdehyde dehydrogenase